MAALWKRLWGSDTGQDEREFPARRGKSPLKGSTRQVIHPARLGLGELQLDREGWGTHFLLGTECRDSNRCQQGGEKLQETGPGRKAEIVKP